MGWSWLNFQLTIAGLRQTVGQNVDAYQLISCAGARLERAFAGRRWLRQRFQPADFGGYEPILDITVVVTATDAPSVTGIDLQPVGLSTAEFHEQMQAVLPNIPAFMMEQVRAAAAAALEPVESPERDVVCRLELPHWWFGERADGVLALRLVGAGLHALAAVGQHYGLGPPWLRTRRNDGGMPPLYRSFDRHPVQPATDRHTLELINRAWEQLPEGGLLAVGLRKVPQRLRRRQELVAHHLSAVEMPDESAGRMVIWTAPSWPPA